MRKPTTIECLYLDFDGFFASVEQQAKPGLRGRPVGVVPFAGTDRTCVIAASKEAKVFGVQLYDISSSDARQTDMLLDDDAERQRWEKITQATDALNTKYGGTLVHMGDWAPPAGGNAGGKISYTRIPTAEDFW